MAEAGDMLKEDIRIGSLPFLEIKDTALQAPTTTKRMFFDRQSSKTITNSSPATPPGTSHKHYIPPRSRQQLAPGGGDITSALIVFGI
ncbi:hypothetical protein I314_05943 [Cryptococcus bacillisporus CA1873]|uniref:Unplaced genomic scaffold supercont1.15, whole genome shotgun sequence n=2 Tax=Cryptococcus gattii TaxID=552467 RepID=A0A0D0VGT4_CRYGA|nr:hypothetical protein I312_05096 [Cryptococcus bacillisporus CA1280]KIR58317.1 hypothetical protein I314_05943 [Cryptococcus bacillisporus CA1873]|eukprot:KIR58317.1 hypothetical protein I314_05943 [Cryptococcus gattii CA1873]